MPTAHKNVTLSLPEAVVHRFRIYAASRNQSMTSLMTDAIRQMIESEDSGAQAKRRFLARMRKAPSRLKDGVRWTREELHER